MDSGLEGGLMNGGAIIGGTLLGKLLKKLLKKKDDDDDDDDKDKEENEKKDGNGKEEEIIEEEKGQPRGLTIESIMFHGKPKSEKMFNSEEEEEYVNELEKMLKQLRQKHFRGKLEL
jgi:Na+-translocating ferredoxin:NAD+ oxidoreductase RnfG subunit